MLVLSRKPLETEHKDGGSLMAEVTPVGEAKFNF